MADPTDLFLEAARESEERHRQLAQERTEFESAQDMFDDAAGANISAALSDLQELTVTQAQTAARKNQAFEEMQAGVDRLNELNNMPGIVDRVIGPFAALFDPTWDRQKVAGSIRNAQAKIALADSRAALEKKDIQLRQQGRALELERLQRNMQSEGDDITNLQARLQDARTRTADQVTYKTEFIKSASVDEMREARETGFITERDMARAMRADRAQQLALNAAEYQDTLRELNQKSQDDLRQIAASNTPQAALAKDELARRAGRDARGIAISREMLTYKMEAADRPVLDTMLANGEITARQYDMELDRRTRQDMSLRSARNALAMQDKQAEEMARREWLRTADNRTIDNLAEASTQSGVVEHMGMRFTSDELMKVRDNKTSVRVADTMAELELKGAEAGVVGTAQALARGAGYAATDETNPQSVFASVAADANVSPEVRAQSAKLAQLYEMFEAEPDTIHTRGQAELLRNATAELEAARANNLQARLALLPEEQRGATVQWINEGEVKDNQLALASVAQAVAFDQQTGNDAWDSAMTAMRGAMAQVRESDPRIAADPTSTDPQLLLAPVVSNPQSREMVLRAFYDEGTMNVYQQTAVEMGDEQLAAMLTNPNSDLFTNQVLDDVKVFEFLEQTRPDPRFTLEKFERTSKEIARKYAAQELPPAGRFGSVQASVNKVLFNNNVTQAFVANYDRQFFYTRRAMGQRQREAAARAEAASAGPVMGP